MKRPPKTGLFNDEAGRPDQQGLSQPEIRNYRGQNSPKDRLRLDGATDWPQ